jgi:5-enolpyruvylshikimate-3-phosphate synthase
LALPIFTDGKVTLTQTPDNLTRHPALRQLAQLGVDLKDSGNTVTASAIKLPDQNIDMGHDPALLPLALALALRAKRELTVTLPDMEDAVDSARQFLDRMNATYVQNGDTITITPGKLSWDGTWASPDPYYCLGSALAAFVNPGIALENPGQLTSLWPQFWNIYNTLPTGKMKPPPTKEIRNNDKPKHRRIKV